MLIPVRAWASMTDRLIRRFIGVAASALLWMHVGYTSAEVLPVDVIDTHSDYNSTEHTNRTSRMAQLSANPARRVTVKDPTGRTLFYATRSEVRAPAGNLLYRTNDGEIRSPAGLLLYRVVELELRNPSGKILYRISHGSIVTPTGRRVYRLDATRLRDPSGRVLIRLSDEMAPSSLFAVCLAQGLL